MSALPSSCCPHPGRGLHPLHTIPLSMDASIRCTRPPVSTTIHCQPHACTPRGVLRLRPGTRTTLACWPICTSATCPGTTSVAVCASPRLYGGSCACRQTFVVLSS
ncbi:hypothetical protein P171DRAFT_214503 [Karstenula rhodostoma CBS 690.94]|uniref:Uncharacterized protein n=1 Tax=Karstenula rhodostoma CBS 690.94 TaxID=1392251 RepID=A0A9P4UFH5_9PLEO|nr:hypothetical protein P171DRAFT_214503 [Karstenula rhodostoma CBS 690.94]